MTSTSTMQGFVAAAKNISTLLNGAPACAARIAEFERVAQCVRFAAQDRFLDLSAGDFSGFLALFAFERGGRFNENTVGLGLFRFDFATGNLTLAEFAGFQDQDAFGKFAFLFDFLKFADFKGQDLFAAFGVLFDFLRSAKFEDENLFQKLAFLIENKTFSARTFDAAFPAARTTANNL